MTVFADLDAMSEAEWDQVEKPNLCDARGILLMILSVLGGQLQSEHASFQECPPNIQCQS